LKFIKKQGNLFELDQKEAKVKELKQKFKQSKGKTKLSQGDRDELLLLIAVELGYLEG